MFLHNSEQPFRFGSVWFAFIHCNNENIFSFFHFSFFLFLLSSLLTF